MNRYKALIKQAIDFHRSLFLPDDKSTHISNMVRETFDRDKHACDKYTTINDGFSFCWFLLNRAIMLKGRLNVHSLWCLKTF